MTVWIIVGAAAACGIALGLAEYSFLPAWTLIVIGLAVAYCGGAVGGYLYGGPRRRRRVPAASELTALDLVAPALITGGLLVAVTGTAWWLVSLF